MINDQTLAYADIIQQINTIVADSDLHETLEKMLDLLIEITKGESGALYLYDVINTELILHAMHGNGDYTHTLGGHYPCNESVGQTLRKGIPQLLRRDHTPMPSILIDSEAIAGGIIHTMYCMPLMLGDQPVGIVQIFNPPFVEDTEAHLETLRLLCMLIAPHIDRVSHLLDAEHRERRLRDLIEIMSNLSTTLERDKLLDDIMHYAQDLLEVEATSIWIKDEDNGDLVLHVATGERVSNIREVRVPADQGIIGNVTSTGKYIVVNDVDQDAHFYRGVDKKSGFTTRAILCVPLKAPQIDLGGERGQLNETIIGGAQALNKRNGRVFDEEDIALFEMMANQAATILQFSELYNHLSRLYNELALLFNETQRLSEQNYKMFWGIIKGISSFIDRKDPYTRGHSLRVSEFSVAIARQLNLPRTMLEHIQIGGILHDVGKIGVPDEVLKKPSHLTDEEMSKMKLHPKLGMKLLEESDLLWLLPIESQAIEEHHERLDGSGYPQGLMGKRKEDINGNSTSKEGISLIGRIVAVADAFDAMTSDRPYRPGMSVEKALSILREESGIGLDPICVEALVRARQDGDILVQQERSVEHQPFIGEIATTSYEQGEKALTSHEQGEKALTSHEQGEKALTSHEYSK